MWRTTLYSATTASPIVRLQFTGTLEESLIKRLLPLESSCLNITICTLVIEVERFGTVCDTFFHALRSTLIKYKEEPNLVLLISVITSVNSAYQKAAEQGRAFLLSSANDTTCGRPWSLRGQPIFELTDEQLVPYDETMDTTTAQATTTTEAASETQPDTTQILQTLVAYVPCRIMCRNYFMRYL